MKQIIIILAVLLTYITHGQAQVGLGHYNPKSVKGYYVSEFGMGMSRNINSKREPENAINFYSNLGYMKNFKSRWSAGMIFNFSINADANDPENIFGIRYRLSHHFENGLELNVSPGIRFKLPSELLASFPERYEGGYGFDLEFTVSWKDHIGIYARHEKALNNQQGNSDTISLGVFTKGKKSLITTISLLISAAIAYQL